mgnify:CR=1 FL=1
MLEPVFCWYQKHGLSCFFDSAWHRLKLPKYFPDGRNIGWIRFFSFLIDSDIIKIKKIFLIKIVLQYWVVIIDFLLFLFYHIWWAIFVTKTLWVWIFFCSILVKLWCKKLMEKNISSKNLGVKTCFQFRDIFL